MEQTTRQITSMKHDKYLTTLRNARRFDNEVFDLVEEDLNYGLNEDQTNLYLKKGYKLAQMQVLSGFLRKGIDEEFIKVLVEHEELNGYQMQVALEFYQKGVSLKTIEETINSDATPKVMKETFQSVLEKTKAVVKEAEVAPEYVQELVAQITDVVGRIQYQEQRYDELNKKLTIFESTKMDEEIRDNLVQKLADTEEALSSQQDRINSATSTIARLREQSEQKEKDIGRMQARIDILEERLLAKAESKEEKTAEKEPEEVKEEKTVNAEHMVDTQQTIPDVDGTDDPFVKNKYGMPVYYQMPVVDAQGRLVQHVPVERTQRKSEAGIAAMIGRLCFKKKSRQNLVRLVANGNLVPAQLIQIKDGIERGLTEEQLVPMIDNNVSAEKMKIIIDIAEFENSMNY